MSEPEGFNELRLPTQFLEGENGPGWARTAGAELRVAQPDCRVVFMTGQEHAAIDTGTWLFTAEALSFLDAD